MTATGDGATAVLALVEAELTDANDRPAVVGWLQRLCRAAARELPANGVAITLMSAEREPLTAAASSANSVLVEELQFTLGEGPCLEAHRTRMPVLVPDLAVIERTWPGYAEAVYDLGVRAVFAFPMQSGAASFGVLDVYRDSAGHLSRQELTSALTFAEVAMTALVDAQQRPGQVEMVLEDAVDSRFEVYQAQGMLMVQLGVDLGVALVRLRAYAYADERSLGAVARDIVDGTLTLQEGDE